MKITIPKHIKKMVERIADEYEHIYEVESANKRNNEEVYWSIKTDNKTYINSECYLYLAQSAKKFREELDKQETEFFKENDEYVLKKKIVFYIKNYFCDLPAGSCYRVEKEVFCEEQLESALKKKRFKKGVREEAKSILDFIQKRQIMSWGQDDADIDRCFFKYMGTEQEFESLLTQQEYEELTPGDFNPFKEIRVAYLEKSEREMYEEKGMLSEYEEFLNEHLCNGNLSSDLEVFDMWNDIKRTGIYYVFIPKIRNTK